MKKHLTKILVLFVMIVGLAITASAQDDKGKKKKPPRKQPPKILVPKKPKTPKKNKNKKPPQSYSKFIGVRTMSKLS